MVYICDVLLGEGLQYYSMLFTKCCQFLDVTGSS